jgi:hypothetical protein
VTLDAVQLTLPSKMVFSEFRLSSG